MVEESKRQTKFFLLREAIRENHQIILRLRVLEQDRVK